MVFYLNFSGYLVGIPERLLHKCNKFWGGFKDAIHRHHIKYLIYFWKIYKPNLVFFSRNQTGIL